MSTLRRHLERASAVIAPFKEIVGWCRDDECWYPQDEIGSRCAFLDCDRTIIKRVGYVCREGTCAMWFPVPRGYRRHLVEDHDVGRCSCRCDCPEPAWRPWDGNPSHRYCGRCWKLADADPAWPHGPMLPVPA